MSHMRKHFYMLNEDALNQIERAIDNFLELSGAQCVMLIDHTGYLIHQAGHFDLIHPEELSTIAAGSFSAYQSLVEMSNAPEMSLQLFEPLNGSLYFLQINKYIFALVFYRSNLCSCEHIRKSALNALLRLAPVLDRDETDVAPKPTENFILQKLDELFD